MRGEARELWGRLAGAALWALSVGYGAALELHLAGYRVGIARRRRLRALVISIGNLTVGGTGKTTAAIAVARWMSERGQRVAVLSRGYGRSGQRKSVVVSEGFGPLVDWREAGDEAFLMARALPEVFVLVGKDRRLTGRRAVEKLGAEALVLDDGFQYQRLYKDVEVVLVDALAPFGYDFLVPRGLLREPPRHLARADAVWITHCDLVREGDVREVRDRVERLAPGARVWETTHAPVRLRRLNDEEEIGPAGDLPPGRGCPPEALHGRRVYALSGVGNPLAFERTLEKLGAMLEGSARFPDHHAYRAEELRELAEGEAASAEWMVTTEKDAVRLPAAQVGKPIWTLQVELAGWGEGPSGSRPSALSEELDWLLSAKVPRRTRS